MIFNLANLSLSGVFGKLNAISFCLMLHAASIIALGKYCTVLYCTVLHCTVLYCTALYCTALYCTVLYCTVLCCTRTRTTVISYVIAPSPSPPLPSPHTTLPVLPFHYSYIGAARSDIAVYMSMACFSAGACALPMVLGFLTDEVSHATPHDTTPLFFTPLHFTSILHPNFLHKNQSYLLHRDFKPAVESSDSTQHTATIICCCCCSCCCCCYLPSKPI